MKTTSLTIRGCPPELRNDLKKSAQSNHRSLNRETLAWLERQKQQNRGATCSELAQALIQWQKKVPRKDRLEIARHIEEARQRMNNEHLH